MKLDVAGHMLGLDAAREIGPFLRVCPVTSCGIA